MIEIDLSLDGFRKTNSKKIPKTIRENKGISLIDLPRDYIVVDIETTGLDCKYNEIIEIGALKVRDNKVVDTYNTLVKPKYEIDSFIEEFTGITNEMVANSPDIKTVLPAFTNFISNELLLGYNVNFDINFLYDNYKNCYNEYITNNYVDVLRLCRKIYPDLFNHRLKRVAKFLNIDLTNHHRAIRDCEITKGIYDSVRQHIADNNIDLKELFKNKWSVDLRELKTEKTEFDEDNFFFNKYVCFTGKLEKMVRADAGQIVVDLGGRCENSVTKNTNFLVLGNNDYCSTIKDGKSTKQKKAEKLILEGQDLEIISENTFYDILNFE